MKHILGQDNEDKVNSNLSALYTLRSCDRWLSVRLELFANAIVLTSGLLLSLSAANADRPGIAGKTGVGDAKGVSLMSLVHRSCWLRPNLCHVHHKCPELGRAYCGGNGEPNEQRGAHSLLH